MFTHYLIRRRLGAFLDGALAAPQARAAEAHVARCTICRNELDVLRRLKAALQRSLRPAEPDWTGFWEGVVRGIEEQRLGTREAAQPARRQPVWRSQWALGGALAAMVLLSVTVWRNMGVSPVGMGDAPVVVNAASTGEPDRGVMVYSTPDKAVTVVWLFDGEP